MADMPRSPEIITFFSDIQIPEWWVFILIQNIFPEYIIQAGCTRSTLISAHEEV